MTIEIGNAPCSRGRGIRGRSAQSAVLRDCAAAHCRGIEPGPVGDMPKAAVDLGEALVGIDGALPNTCVGISHRSWARFDPVHETARGPDSDTRFKQIATAVGKWWSPTALISSLASGGVCYRGRLRRLVTVEQDIAPALDARSAEDAQRETRRTAVIGIA